MPCPTESTASTEARALVQPSCVSDDTVGASVGVVFTASRNDAMSGDFESSDSNDEQPNPPSAMSAPISWTVSGFVADGPSAQGTSRPCAAAAACAAAV